MSILACNAPFEATNLNNTGGCSLKCMLPCDPLPIYDPSTWDSLRIAHLAPGLLAIPLNLIVLGEVILLASPTTAKSGARKRKAKRVPRTKLIGAWSAVCALTYAAIDTIPSALSSGGEMQNCKGNLAEDTVLSWADIAGTRRTVTGLCMASSCSVFVLQALLGGMVWLLADVHHKLSSGMRLSMADMPLWPGLLSDDVLLPNPSLVLGTRRMDTIDIAVVSIFDFRSQAAISFV